MRIYIYTNGGKNIGMGHIIRTLTLGKKIREKGFVKYFSSYVDQCKEGVERIKRDEFEVIDAKNIERLDKDCVLIVDNYDITKEQLSDLRKKVKLLCYIDDNNHLEYYDVDLLINQNVHGVDLNYNLINSSILAGGKYALLRDEFLNQKPIKINKDVKEILVTVGGSDNSNLTNRILREIKYFNSKINVVIGSAFAYKDELIEEYRDYQNIVFHFNPKMSELMARCDLAISACGSTLYELSYLGIPTIGLIIVDNQRLLGQYMDRNNLIKLSSVDNLYSDLKSITYEDRTNFSNKMKGLIDGKGVNRIIDEIEQLLSTKGDNHE